MPKIINGCVVTAFYCNNDPRRVFQCNVTLDSDEIRIEWSDQALIPFDDETVTQCYHGWQIAPGHFRLVGMNQGDTATLHAFPNSHRLEGCWQENRSQGMWMIELPETLDAR